MGFFDNQLRKGMALLALTTGGGAAFAQTGTTAANDAEALQDALNAISNSPTCQENSQSMHDQLAAISEKYGGITLTGVECNQPSASIDGAALFASDDMRIAMADSTMFLTDSLTNLGNGLKDYGGADYAVYTQIVDDAWQAAAAESPLADVLKGTTLNLDALNQTASEIKSGPPSLTLDQIAPGAPTMALTPTSIVQVVEIASNAADAIPGAIDAAYAAGKMTSSPQYTQMEDFLGNLQQVNHGLQNTLDSAPTTTASIGAPSSAIGTPGVPRAVSQGIA